jgi:hypothetical protein
MPNPLRTGRKMKITQKVEFTLCPDSYFSGWGAETLEFKDASDNKIVIKLTPEQFRQLGKSLTERYASHVERLKEKEEA